MKRIRDLVWPVIGVVAVVWSVQLLYTKLRNEVASDPNVLAELADASFWSELGMIVAAIVQKLADLPAQAYVLAALSTLVAYAALAWYDRIALLHLNRAQGISWAYVAACSFVTYAVAHNICASVLSGGVIRYRAYSAKGLTASEVAVLVALCSYTFAFGVLILTGVVFVWKPELLAPLAKLGPAFAIGEFTTRVVGALMLGFCALYTIGAWLHLRPLTIGSFELVYPRLPIVVRQYLAAPLELLGAAGIIYFALPAEGNPGFAIVLGAFLVSFSVGLLSQVPGGVGVMEAVFLAILPDIAPTAVFAALLIWRLFYLIIPLALSIPVIIAFEHSQLGRSTKRLDPPRSGH